VLLILLTNLPRGKYKRPHDMLVALVANQLMVVFGVAAIFYSGTAKAVLFALGALAGCVVFQTAFVTFVSAHRSFPNHAHGILWATAACFFVGWMVFPVLWLVGPEGYGTLALGISNTLHAATDLIAKNLFGMLSWTTRYRYLAPWEEEQRVKREAARRARAKKASADASDSSAVDPAFARAYDDAEETVSLVVRRTPATISACTTVLDRASRYLESRRVRVLLVEEDAACQRQMLDAFDAVEECEVRADVLFSVEDVPRLYERGVPGYAAVFINGSMLAKLQSMTADTAEGLDLDVYTPSDFREEARELRRLRLRGVRKVVAMREAAAQAAAEAAKAHAAERRPTQAGAADAVPAVGTFTEDDAELFDEVADAHAALAAGDELPPTQRLFGARAIVAYRLGASAGGKVKPADKGRLGFNVLMRHPLDSLSMSRVFTKLSAHVGVPPVDVAEDDVLETVLGAVEVTAMVIHREARVLRGRHRRGHRANLAQQARDSMLDVPRRGIERVDSGLAMMTRAIMDDEDSASCSIASGSDVELDEDSKARTGPEGQARATPGAAAPLQTYPAGAATLPPRTTRGEGDRGGSPARRQSSTGQQRRLPREFLARAAAAAGPRTPIQVRARP